MGGRTGANGLDGFGARLRARREELGWSRRDVERASGITDHAVAKLEVGLSHPTLATAVRLARALGVSVESLAGVGLCDAPAEPPPKPAHKPRGRPRKPAQDAG